MKKGTQNFSDATRTKMDLRMKFDSKFILLSPKKGQTSMDIMIVMVTCNVFSLTPSPNTKYSSKTVWIECQWNRIILFAKSLCNNHSRFTNFVHDCKTFVFDVFYLFQPILIIMNNLTFTLFKRKKGNKLGLRRAKPTSSFDWTLTFLADYIL